MKCAELPLYCFIGILSGLFWGANDVFTALLSQHVVLSSVFAMLVFSALLAFVQDLCSAASIVGYYSCCSRWTVLWRKMASARKIILVSAFCAGPLGLLCSILAILNLGPVYAGAITAGYPLVALLGSRFYLRESLSRQRVFGVLIGVVAVVLIVLLDRSSGASPHFLLGVCFAVVALLGWGMEAVFFSAAYNRTGVNSSALLAMRQMCSSFFYFLILLVCSSSCSGFYSLVVQVVSGHGLMILCVLSAGLSYLAYYYCIKVLSASTATLFNVTFIFWSAIISSIIGFAVLPALFWCGAVLLFAAVFFALRG